MRRRHRHGVDLLVVRRQSGRLMKAPLVVVEWDDAWTNEMGVTLEDARASHKPMPVRTIGWLLIDDEVGVSLANEYFDDGSFRGRTFILRCMVRSVTKHTLAKI